MVSFQASNGINIYRMKTIHFHSSRGCLSYITYDTVSLQGALIDPSEEIDKNVYMQALKDNDVTLLYILETHTHADHISSAKILLLHQKPQIRMYMMEILFFWVKKYLLFYTHQVTPMRVFLYITVKSYLQEIHSYLVEQEEQIFKWVIVVSCMKVFMKR